MENLRNLKIRCFTDGIKMNSPFKFQSDRKFYSAFGNVLKQKNNISEKTGGILVLQSDFNLNHDNSEFLKRINKLIIQSISLCKTDTTISALDYDKIYYSYGNFFIGAYKDSDSGYTYNKKSLSFEIIGISSEMLRFIANAVKIEFNQQQILVKEYKSGGVYLVK